MVYIFFFGCLCTKSLIYIQLTFIINGYKDKPISEKTNVSYRYSAFNISAIIAIGYDVLYLLYNMNILMRTFKKIGRNNYSI